MDTVVPQTIETILLEERRYPPPQGFAAQVTASGVLYTVATQYGFPVSTTHVISGSVMGAGATTKMSAVRWGVAADIVGAWLLTIPAAAVVSAILYALLSLVF